MIAIGSEVKDTITGFKGILTAKTEWKNGCTRFGIQGRIDKDGKVPDLFWADEQDVVEMKKSGKKLLKEKLGGPKPNPQRNIDPQR